MRVFIISLTFFQLVACSQTGSQPNEIKHIEQQHEMRFTDAMQQTLDALFKHKSSGVDDPKKLKAMKILAKTDAAKSYAYTQIYAVSAQFCGDEVKQQLSLYQHHAANIIALGAYYYQHGIEAKLGDQDFSQTGEALTAGLLEMTEQLTIDHETASESQLKNKCQEAASALRSLTLLYGE